MLIEFIGAPCSGKTTTAAQVFALLKDEGTPAEFVAEQARLYIARQRYQRNLGPHDSIVLTDEDQLEIMRLQLETEQVLKAACGSEVVIVSDTSPISALLYMRGSDRLKTSVPLWNMVNEAVRQVDLVFYAHPVPRISAHDPNRIHSLEQSLAIDARIPGLLDALLIHHIPLFGSANERLALAMREIYSRRG